MVRAGCAMLVRHGRDLKCPAAVDYALRDATRAELEAACLAVLTVPGQVVLFLAERKMRIRDRQRDSRAVKGISRRHGRSGPRRTGGSRSC